MLDLRRQFHPEVEESDLLDIALHIAQDNPEAATRVVTAIRDMSYVLVEQPFLGTEYHPLRKTLKGIRMIPVTEYRNYVIYYRPLPDNAGVRILYVLHAARDAATFAREHRRN